MPGLEMAQVLTTYKYAMKYIKTFESFISKAEERNVVLPVNETVYSTGLGGNLMYSSSGNSSVKSKALSILKSNKWQKSSAGKYALEKGEKTAMRWNQEDPSKWPGWFKEYSVDKNGQLNASNFINVTAVIVAVLDEITKRVKAEWIQAGGATALCFRNASKWAENENGNAIGGICIQKDDIGDYFAEDLIVHAFGEKDKKYYEMTFPNENITKNTIYWPLIIFNEADERQIAEDIWSYALAIEEAVKEHISML